MSCRHIMKLVFFFNDYRTLSPLAHRSHEKRRQAESGPRASVAAFCCARGPSSGGVPCASTRLRRVAQRPRRPGPTAGCTAFSLTQKVLFHARFHTQWKTLRENGRADGRFHLETEGLTPFFQKNTQKNSSLSVSTFILAIGTNLVTLPFTLGSRTPKLVSEYLLNISNLYFLRY